MIPNKRNEWLRLFGIDNLNNIPLTGQNEQALEQAIRRAQSDNGLDTSVEDKIRKGLQLHTKMLEHHNIPAHRNLNALKMFVSKKAGKTRFQPDQGVVYINPSQLEDVDTLHELEHFFENTSMGMPVADKARNRYYNHPTTTIPISARTLGGTPLSGIPYLRTYKPLLDMGADYYGATANGFGYGTEHYPQILTRSAADPNGVQGMLIKAMGFPNTLTPELIDDITDVMGLASNGIRQREAICKQGVVKNILPNDPIVDRATTELKKAMRKVADLQEEMRIRLAYYHNAAMAHIKHATIPNNIDKDVLAKNYDITGIPRPQSFDEEDIGALRQMLKTPVSRTPNTSIVDFDQRDLPRAITPNTTSTILQPFF